MEEKDRVENKDKNKKWARSAKECAYFSVFVAILIAVQFALSFVPGVELVTVLFVTYSFVMGIRRGVISAVAFTLLRQIVFGFFPTVLIQYIIYYPLLAACFGFLGNKIKAPLKFLAVTVLVACVFTVCFTMLDNLITPLWYGLGRQSAYAYFIGSLPFLISQVICTAVSVTCLF